jgi:hypothetical protein
MITFGNNNLRIGRIGYNICGDRISSNHRISAKTKFPATTGFPVTTEYLHQQNFL